MAEDSKTQYTHTAYAWSADGTDRFTTVYPGENLLLNTSKELTTITSSGWGKSPTSLASETYGAGKYYASAYIENTTPVEINFYVSVYVGGKFIYNSSGKNIPAGQSGVISFTFDISEGQRVASGFAGFANEQTKSYTYKYKEMMIKRTPTPWTPSPFDDPDGAYPKFIGTYTDYTVEASTDPSKYTWAKNGIDRSKQVLRIYKGSVRAVDGIIGTKRAFITGLSAGTVVKAGEYQACYVDGVVESKKVDVPGFTVTAPSVVPAGVMIALNTPTATPTAVTTTGAKTDTAAITVEA